MPTYSPHNRGHGKPHSSPQVKRMETMSKSCHPGLSKCSPKVNPVEERTESASERKMEVKTGEE